MVGTFVTLVWTGPGATLVLITDRVTRRMVLFAVRAGVGVVADTSPACVHMCVGLTVYAVVLCMSVAAIAQRMAVPCIRHAVIPSVVVYTPTDSIYHLCMAFTGDAVTCSRPITALT
jgi:hypothetical protein